MDFLLAGPFSVVLRPFGGKFPTCLCVLFKKKRCVWGNPNKTCPKNICHLNRTS